MYIIDPGDQEIVGFDVRYSLERVLPFILWDRTTIRLDTRWK